MTDTANTAQDPTAASAGQSATGQPERPRRLRLSWKKKLLFASVISVVACIVLAAVAELLLRWFAPQPLMPRYVRDSGFGIRTHCANISIHHTTADYRVGIRTNSDGIRADREFSRAKPSGVFRIVGVGDSFTFGYGVEVEHTYLARLETLLQQAGINAEVINLGVAGHGTAEQLIMLQEVGWSYDPDLVIVGYYTNDIGDNVRSSLYALDEGGGLRRSRDAYLPGVKTREKLYSFAAYRYLAERSHLLYLVRRTVSEAMQTQLHKQRRQEASLNRDDERLLTGALLDEIKRLCAARGTAVCILDIPDANYRSNLPRGALQTVTEADIVDLRPRFHAVPPATQLYWTRSDGHWTPAGHQLAAESLAEHILASLSDTGRGP